MRLRYVLWYSSLWAIYLIAFWQRPSILDRFFAVAGYLVLAVLFAWILKTKDQPGAAEPQHSIKIIGPFAMYALGISLSNTTFGTGLAFAFPLFTLITNRMTGSFVLQGDNTIELSYAPIFPFLLYMYME